MPYPIDYKCKFINVNSVWTNNAINVSFWMENFLYVKRSQRSYMVFIQHSDLDLTCLCVYGSEFREYPPPDLITVSLHKPLWLKEVKATAIYYPQSISHSLYSGFVKHTPLSVSFFSSQQCVQHRKYNSLSLTH